MDLSSEFGAKRILLTPNSGLWGEKIEIDWLNDDKIGRIMDKLYLKGLSSIFLSLALFACHKYKI